MKKTIVKILALTLVVAMACAMLVSCGGPNADPKKAKAALEEAGYIVVLNTGDGLLSGALLPDELEASLVATKEGEYIAISYYKESKDVNEAWEKAQEDAKKLEEQYEGIVCKKSGKMIYIGTEQAVKDAQ